MSELPAIECLAISSPGLKSTAEACDKSEGTLLHERPPVHRSDNTFSSGVCVTRWDGKDGDKPLKYIGSLAKRDVHKDRCDKPGWNSTECKSVPLHLRERGFAYCPWTLPECRAKSLIKSLHTVRPNSTRFLLSTSYDKDGAVSATLIGLQQCTEPWASTLQLLSRNLGLSEACVSLQGRQKQDQLPGLEHPYEALEGLLKRKVPFKSTYGAHFREDKEEDELLRDLHGVVASYTEDEKSERLLIETDHESAWATGRGLEIMRQVLNSLWEGPEVPEPSCCDC
jgi:hypothetical protein